MKRKQRLGDEYAGHATPAEGPNVFPEHKDEAGVVYIEGVIGLDGTRKGLRCRFPSGTRRKGSVPDPPVKREIIFMADKPKVTVTQPDPYDTYGV